MASSSDDCQVVGIIDWQHSKALPLFLQAAVPGHFQDYGDSQAENLVKPYLPADFDGMDDSGEQKLEQYRRRVVGSYYTAATVKKTKRHFDAIMHPGGLFRCKIFAHVAEPWESNSIPLKADLIHLIRHWSALTANVDSFDGRPPLCPLELNEEGTDNILQGVFRQERVDGQLAFLRSTVRVGIEGWVANDDYDMAVARSAHLKEEALKEADDDEKHELFRKYWPFDDFDEKE